MEFDSYQSINVGFASSDKGDTTTNSPQRVAMKEELFDEPLESVHEGAIVRAEKSPSRKFTFVSMNNGESVSHGQGTRRKMLRLWIITDERRKNDG